MFINFNLIVHNNYKICYQTDTLQKTTVFHSLWKSHQLLQLEVNGFLEVCLQLKFDLLHHVY